MFIFSIWEWTLGKGNRKNVLKERFINDLSNHLIRLNNRQTPSDNHNKSEVVELDCNSQGTHSSDGGIRSPELTESPSAFDFYNTTRVVSQTTEERTAEPVVLEVNKRLCRQMPVYKVAEPEFRLDLEQMLYHQIFLMKGYI